MRHDLDDIEFFWENPQLEVDAVFRPRIDTLFWPTAFDSLARRSVEDPILLDDDKENSPPTTPVSERPNRPLS